MHILVVDDDPSVRALLVTQLELAGHEVLDAEDGAVALRLLRGRLVDAVVLDVMMPNVTGWDVLTAIRAQPETRQLPVVVLTGRSSTDDRERARDLGASAVLSKPYAEQDLLAILSALHAGPVPLTSAV